MNRYNVASKSSFCKICYDAGKSESIYGSHNVRDRYGNTTCPYLLTLRCRRCDKLGHTQSHCTATIKTTQASVSRDYKKPEKKHPATSATLPKLSTFSKFYDDDDEEPDVRTGSDNESTGESTHSTHSASVSDCESDHESQAITFAIKSAGKNKNLKWVVHPIPDWSTEVE